MPARANVYGGGFPDCVASGANELITECSGMYLRCSVGADIKALRRWRTSMSLFRPLERVMARAYSGLVSGNPFLPERIEHERTALGPDFVVGDRVWHPRADVPENPNLAALYARAERLA